MEKFKQSILVANVRLDGAKRLDIALRGVYGLGSSAALALAYEAASVDPKDPLLSGSDTLALLPKLSSLDQAALASLGAKISAMPVEGALRDRERALSREKESLAKAVAKSSARKAA